MIDARWLCWVQTNRFERARCYCSATSINQRPAIARWWLVAVAASFLSCCFREVITSGTLLSDGVACRCRLILLVMPVHSTATVTKRSIPKTPGAVAAPTAGLHFDQPLIDRLHQRGVAWGAITLHVGAGTFQPVRCQDIRSHRMHYERIEVGEQVCQQIAQTQAQGGRIIAVGSTVVRALESAAQSGGLMPDAMDTDLFIFPGYKFNVVDALVTNFHLPKSTLLIMVSAFAGYERIMAAYRHAIDNGYRFYSLWGCDVFAATAIKVKI